MASMEPPDGSNPSPQPRQGYSPAADSDPASPSKPPAQAPRSASWIYRKFTVFGWQFPGYASPAVQLVIVSLVCFLCPAMFNALQGMGGGGQVDATAQNKANTALYSTFAVVGFFAGTLTNRLGVRLTLAIGGLGYCVYVASFLSYEYTKNKPFVIFAGALLGLCAGMLWTAQGAIMMSYPPEKSKGRYISLFWVIFNLGAVVGSLIPLGQTIHSENTLSVSTGTYVGFLVLTFAGAVLSLCLVDSEKVVRSDGSRVCVPQQRTWKTEILGLVDTLVKDKWVLLLFPMFFASNWFYTYQFNNVNLARFTVRTRSLNGVVYWAMQMVGAVIFGYLLDSQRLSRPIRARNLFFALVVLTMGIWGGGYAFQRGYTRQTVATDASLRIDWTDSRYGGPLVLYMAYGFYDAIWQTSVYWFMGALTNKADRLANYAGFYKGIQSAGAAIVWRLDDLEIPYMNLFASSWALLMGSLLVAAPLILFRIRESSEEEPALPTRSAPDEKPGETEADEPLKAPVEKV